MRGNRKEGRGVRGGLNHGCCDRSGLCQVMVLDAAVLFSLEEISSEGRRARLERAFLAGIFRDLPDV